MSRKDRRRKTKQAKTAPSVLSAKKNGLTKAAIITLASISIIFFLFLVSVR